MKTNPEELLRDRATPKNETVVGVVERVFGKSGF